MTTVLIFGTAPDDRQETGRPSSWGRLCQFQRGLQDAGLQTAVALINRDGRCPSRQLNGASVNQLWPTEAAQCRMIAKHSPQIVLVCGWRNWFLRRAAKVPMILDLFRPELLEQHPAAVNGGVEAKLRALCHASLVTCATDYQRDYYMGWLFQAGIMPDQQALRTVYWSPVSQPPLQENGERAFFDHAERDTSHGDKVLARHRLQDFRSESDPVPGQHVRSDCPTTELTAATESLDRLWRGVPVICNSRAELADAIEDAGAGWAFDRPEDLSGLLEEIRREPEKLRQRGGKARELAESRFGLQDTLEPIIDFCRKPTAPERLFQHRLYDETREAWQAMIKRMKQRARSILVRIPMAYGTARWVYRACRAIPRRVITGR